jgi:hypothetical protein
VKARMCGKGPFRGSAATPCGKPTACRLGPFFFHHEAKPHDEESYEDRPGKAEPFRAVGGGAAELAILNWRSLVRNALNLTGSTPRQSRDPTLRKEQPTAPPSVDGPC